MEKPKYEVADILREGFFQFNRKNKIPIHKVKAANAIMSCRTSKLGAHLDQCDECNHIRISYNSCRNRHCPKCQNLAKEKWLEDRKSELLPVQYFHVVFTIPDLLNEIILKNQTEMYNLLFKTTSKTIIDLCKNRIKADSGLIAILHTWGQNLIYHPHLHCIVPGGGVSENRLKWNSSKKKYLIPIKIISAVFKGKFLQLLKELYKEKKLNFIGKLAYLYDKKLFQKLLDQLYQKKWVVFAKKPFATPMQVFNYLGRYTHRVAISNNRILNVEKGIVSFKWKDYKDCNRIKMMKLSVEEFIRRFINHILPHGFFKIRYFGILSSRIRKEIFEVCRRIMNYHPKIKIERKNWKELFHKLTGVDITSCPCCKSGVMSKLGANKPP